MRRMIPGKLYRAFVVVCAGGCGEKITVWSAAQGDPEAYVQGHRGITKAGAVETLRKKGWAPRLGHWMCERCKTRR